MYFQSIKEGFLKPFPKQNTHKQRYLSQATNAHDLTHCLSTRTAAGALCFGLHLLLWAALVDGPLLLLTGR